MDLEDQADRVARNTTKGAKEGTRNMAAGVDKAADREERAADQLADRHRLRNRQTHRVVE